MGVFVCEMSPEFVLQALQLPRLGFPEGTEFLEFVPGMQMSGRYQNVIIKGSHPDAPTEFCTPEFHRDDDGNVRLESWNPHR